MEIEAQSSSVDLSTNDLAAQIIELAGHLNAANHRWLMLIAEFDRRNGWSDWGTQSCAHWLNWRCGIDMDAAREKVRLAHRCNRCRRSLLRWRAVSLDIQRRVR